MADAGEDFASALKSLRGDISQRELGRRANCSKSIIGSLEQRTRQPTMQIAMSLDAALHADGRLTALAACRPGSGGFLDGLFREWDDVQRRAFLIGGGAIGATVLAGIGGRPAGGAELMDAHAALRAAHGRLDNLRGASAVHASAVDHHRQVLAWQASVSTQRERCQIARMAADTGGFVGFLSYDLGMTDVAVHHFRDAAGQAQDAGDAGLCANNLGQMSRVISDQGHRREALHLMDGALRLAGAGAHPGVLSWLHAVRAYHHATLGDAGPSQQDLSAAWKLLERADDGEVPAYVGYISSAELGKWTGHSLTRLSRPALARSSRKSLDAALKEWPATAVRGSAEVLTACARAYLATGDRDAASGLVSQAVGVATTTGSARNLRAACEVRGLLDAQHGTS
jgi:transcriptional regulator with XRE-family HTH domain